MNVVIICSFLGLVYKLFSLIEYLVTSPAPPVGGKTIRFKNSAILSCENLFPPQEGDKGGGYYK
jgi:hypothetical protein